MTPTRLITSFTLLLAHMIVPACPAETLTIGSDHGPPHMIEQSISGIDIDITRELLSKMGIEADFKFVGLGRARKKVISMEFDAMVPAFLQPDEPGFYVSDAVISYRPTVFSLAKNKFTPELLANLEGHTLVSFQGAIGYFGDRFEKITLASPYYIEASHMRTIPFLVAKDRFDYAVLDRYIFYYYFRQGNIFKDISIFREHNLIPQSFAGVGFADKAMRDKFNTVAKGFLKSDEYQAIVARYIGSVY